MNKKKLLGTAAAATALVLALAGCSGSGNSSSSGSSDKKPTVAIIAKGFQFAYWQAVKKGAEQEAKKLGASITFDGPPKETDVDQQITMLQTALAKKPDALGFAALDSKAAAPYMQQAKSDGIPVIAFDSGVDSPVPVTTAATNNKKAAALAAKHMADLIGNKGTVAVVGFDQTSESGKDRIDGFLNWMKKNAPDIKVLTPQFGAGDLTKSADIAKNFLTANPDLAGIYGANEGSAEGVAQGVKEAGMSGKVTVVGFDSGKAQIDAIKDGTMAGAITQNPVGIGEKVVWAALQAIKGKSLPKTIDTGAYWYDKSNLNDPKIQALLYQ
ncbi:ABC transporter substrate-binding protein [Humibacter albus]|jgi:ribose transport system substrate-binding protein|uniref:ABC transporter substrate-binding protein n=1 Tax=Humibacter albus TaxID=427754 RepID=UPI0003B455E3|nr:ABC transporter substrate-binding protein [Humibacter albus]